MPVPAGTSTPPTPDIVLSADEQAAWQVTMVEIRDAMGQQDFSLASQLLRAAETQVKTAQQRSQHSRLNALKQLTEDFHSALIQAIQGLSPGASFNVKSTVVAFVDGSEEQIIIRVEGGRSQTHALVDIPPGLAFGLVDLSMDIASPNSLARKAAFSIVHPKRNQLVLNQAEKWMAEAIAAGAIPQDMTEIFSDLP